MESVIGQSVWSQTIRQQLAWIGPLECNVFIRGPEGTAKVELARAIHRSSRRAGGRFIPVDFGAISGELLTSQLFGAEPGALPGMDHPTLGAFRAADGGTLLLDHVDVLEADLQTQLAQALATRQVVPLGSNVPLPVDVRVIAASGRDLTLDVQQGRFLSDLFVRLHEAVLETIPLRERVDDVIPLCEHFLERLAKERGYPMLHLSSEARAKLRTHHWPDNERELFQMLERAAALNEGESIRPDQLSLDEAEIILCGDQIVVRSAEHPPSASGPRSPAVRSQAVPPKSIAGFDTVHDIGSFSTDIAPSAPRRPAGK